MGELVIRRSWLIGAVIFACATSVVTTGCATSDSEDEAVARQELRRDLNRALSRAPTIVSEPSGVDTLRLHGGFQHAVMMREEPDGTVTYNCVDNLEAAEAFMFDGKIEGGHEH